MPIAFFVSPEGVEQQVEVPDLWSLMEAARRDDVPGIVAECGGGAICGTCHVHVDPQWADKLDEADMSEQALLEVVPQRCATSRLACQIIMSPELDGIRVVVPSEQFTA